MRHGFSIPESDILRFPFRIGGSEDRDNKRCSRKHPGAIDCYHPYLGEPYS